MPNNIETIPADQLTLSQIQEKKEAEIQLTDGKGKKIEGVFRKDDQKSSAYAAMASLLGMKKTVPQAKPLVLKDSEGNEVEGSFVRKMQGVSTDEPGKELAGIDEKAFLSASPQALKEISDLQVLDFLYGNAERSSSDMVYSFDDKGRLAGVQGKTGELSSKKENTVMQPGQISLIRAQTANKLRKLSRAELKEALEGKAKPETVEKACRNLDQLKEALPQIRELDDQGFEKLDPAELIETDTPNLFQKASQAMPVIGFNASLGKAAIAPGMKEVGGRMTPGGVYGQIEKADDLLKTLADHDPESSQGMKDAVMEYKDLEQGVLRRINRSVGREQQGEKSTKTIYDQNVSIWDADKMNRSLHNIKNQASQFLTNKQEGLQEQEPSASDKKQMDDAKKLIRFADEGLSLSPNERKALEKNEEKAALKNERLKEGKVKQSQQAEGPTLG